MLHKLTVTFEETTLTKFYENSQPYVESTWTNSEFYRTEDEKESILNRWKNEEYSETEEVSASPYRSGMVEEITSVKIKSIEDVSLLPVTKYFFMYSNDIGVNECSDGFGGTEYKDEIPCWSKSKYFDDEELAYFESLKYGNCTPVIKGVVYQDIKE